MPDELKQLLTRASMAPLASKLSQAPPYLQSRLLLAVQQLRGWLSRPSSVLDLWLFRDGRLIRRETYDPIANRFVPSPVSHHDVLAAVHDFMRDTFGGNENWVAYTVGDFQVVGVLEGRHTLAAITRAGVDADTIQRWLQQLLQKLAREG